MCNINIQNGFIIHISTWTSKEKMKMRTLVYQVNSMHQLLPEDFPLKGRTRRIRASFDWFILTSITWPPWCCCSWSPRTWRCWYSCCAGSLTSRRGCTRRSPLWKTTWACNTPHRPLRPRRHRRRRHASFQRASATTEKKKKRSF